MKFRKGNLVEVLRREHDPCGSWFPGNIVSVEGNDYAVRYKFLLDEEGEPLLEKVHGLDVRPLPLHEVAKRWRVGDIAEVFDNQCWRVGKIAKVLPKNGFVIRLFESIQLKEFHESNLRIRKSSHINQWSVTGKIYDHAKRSIALFICFLYLIIQSDFRKQEIYGLKPAHMDEKIIKVAPVKHFTTENDSKYSLNLLSRAQSLRMDKDLLQGEKDGQGFCEDDHDDSKMCLPVGNMKRRRSDNNETNSGDLLIAGSDKKRKSSPWVGGRKRLQTGTSPLFRQVADISFSRVQLNEKFTGGSTEMDTKMVKGATDQFHISSATLLSSEDSNQCSVGSCSSNEFADCPGENVHKSVENVSNDSDAESSFPSLSGKKHEFPFPSHKLEADIHELELHAYESTVQALYASGPLSWEQESLLTNLRLSLNISDEEHLLQLRHLLSAQVV